MNMELLWNNFLGKIQERISPLAYDTWFKDTKLYKMDNGTAIIVVPYILHKKHLETKYIDYIEDIGELEDIEDIENDILNTLFSNIQDTIEDIEALCY